MIKKQLNQEEDIYQTIQLTAKLENNLRRLISSRKNTQVKTPYTDTQFDRSQMPALQAQLRSLRAENKELVADNQQLCRDLIHLKQQNRQQKKIISQHAKYIEYLQGYNQDLKKQLVFWMRKPLTNVRQEHEHIKDNTGVLMTEMLKLKKQNQTKQFQLKCLKRTMTEYCDQSNEKQFFKPKLRLKEKLEPKENETSKSLKIQKFKTPNQKIANQCTSCNYQQYSKSRGKKITGSASFTGKKKTKKKSDLCECHKKYIETSKFLF